MNGICGIKNNKNNHDTINNDNDKDIKLDEEDNK